MKHLQEYAEQLRADLALALPPVAMAFGDRVPEGVKHYPGTAPAGCLFWQEAATRTFATSAPDHALCAIGTHTHRLRDAPPSQTAELQDALAAMEGLDYVRSEEAAGIPVMAEEHALAIYGPLAEFPMAPQVVILFAHARQSLILSEAAARVDEGMPAAMGRPACAMVPRVINHDVAAMSLGCCGARAYLDVMSDAVALWALPGRKLDGYTRAIRALSGANRLLADFHARRRRAVESGTRPSVKESLNGLSP